ncbi:hypothetical protein [Maricaulis sp. CAU 1757]
MSGRDLIGLFNLLIITAVLGVISYAAFVLKPAEYDAETLCLADTVPPHRVVVIDKTDLYSPLQAETIANLVRAERDRLAVGERFSLYELSESGELRNTHRFSLCNPGAGEQVNPLYRNPDRVQARYNALFDIPLQTALADLVAPKNAPSSPIIEALARLSQDRTFDPSAPHRQAVLVSDMLQNSALFTVYGRRHLDLADRVPPAADIARQIQVQYGDSLRGLSLEIRVIERPGWEIEQRGSLMAYWDEIFAQLGVEASWYEL